MPERVQRIAASMEPAPDVGPLVLVVEDEPILRSSMVRGLRRLPELEVIDAGTIQDSMAILHALEPNLLITDLDLPDGSGTELIVELDRAGRRIPVIVVSAYVNSYQGALPVRANVSVCEKPLPMRQLRGLVMRQLGAHIVPADEAVTQPFNVTDYVQLACMGRKSIAISLSSRGAVLGQIVVHRGELWAACDGEGAGEAALRRLLFRTDAYVAVDAVAEATLGPPTMSGPWQPIVLEAARISDERVCGDQVERGGAATPTRELGEGPSSSSSRVATATATAVGVARGSREISLSPLRDAEMLASDEAFDRWFDEAIDALIAGHYDQAFEAFQEAAVLRPRDGSVSANLGRLREMGYGHDVLNPPGGGS